MNENNHYNNLYIIIFHYHFDNHMTDNVWNYDENYFWEVEIPNFYIFLKISLKQTVYEVITITGSNGIDGIKSAIFYVFGH